MSKKYKIILIVFIMLLTLCILCACLPDKAKEEYIFLPRGDGNGSVVIGRYNFTYMATKPFSTIYEVKPGEQDGLLDLFRDSQYCIGEFVIPVTQYTESEKSESIYIGQEAIWLTNQNSIWVCQRYGNKRVRVVIFSESRIYNEDNDMVASVSRILFSTSERAKFDEEYATPFSWSQLCKFFPSERVNEEEKFIIIECEYDIPPKELSGEKGTTKIYFNEQNNTITVSSNYVPKGESV